MASNKAVIGRESRTYTGYAGPANAAPAMPSASACLNTHMLHVNKGAEAGRPVDNMLQERRTDACSLIE